MVWSRRLSVSMGNPEDFVKALSEALKDSTVKEQFRTIFQPAIDDLTRDLNSQMDIWRKKFTDDLRQELDSLRKNIKAKDQKIAELETEIEVLKDDQDRLEQYSRRNSLRISGLPEQDGENVLKKVVDLCNNKLKLPVKISDFDRVHRVGKSGSPARPILVKFATYGVRASVFKAKSVLRPGGRHPDAPWTLGMAAGLPDASTASAAMPNNDAASESDGNGNDPDDVNDNEDEIDYTKVFISEDLTRNRQFILWKARLAKKKHIIRDCWTTDGQILLKDNTNKIVPIQSLTQICTKFPAIDVQ